MQTINLPDYQNPVKILKETEHYYLIEGLKISNSWYPKVVKKYAIIERETLKERMHLRVNAMNNNTSKTLDWILDILEKKERHIKELKQIKGKM